jgi:hypothetical protein
MNPTATEANINAKIDDLRKKRDSLSLTSPELETLRDEAVELKKRILAGKNVEENKAKLGANKARRDVLVSDYAKQRGSLKESISKLERELQHSKLVAKSAEFEPLGDAELEQAAQAIIDKRRELKERASALQIVRSQRAARARVQELVANLSEAERAELVAEIERKERKEA